MGALANAQGHLSLEEFRTICSPHTMTFINPRQFAFTTSILTKLSDVCKTLARLHLHLETPEGGKGYKAILANFTACLPSLKELTLDFDGQPGSGLVFRRFVASLDISQLTSINIMGLTIDAASLAKAVTRMSSLADLKLYSVEVSSGSWPAVLKAIQKLENLEHLHLMYLKEAGCKAYFLKQRENDHDGDDMADIVAEGWGSEDDEEDDEDDIPELEAMDDPWESSESVADDADVDADTSVAVATAVATDPEPIQAIQGQATPQVDDDVVSEYGGPEGRSQDFPGERGFYICVEGKEKIAKRLQTFIDEYNVGEFMGHAGDDGFGFPPFAAAGGMAIPMPVGAGAGNLPPPPANFFGLMNAMGNALGFGPPPGAPPDANPGAAPNANLPGNATGNAIGNGVQAHTAPAAAPAPAPAQAAVPNAEAGASTNDELDWESDEEEGVALFDGEVD